MRGPGATRTLARQRHERIVHEVKLRSAVRVADLADLLGVSDMTIRRDLDSLDAAGLVLKVHGGATAIVDHSSNEPGFVTKSLRNTSEKAAIAKVAATMVEPGSSVGISAGTTTWRLAGDLLDVADLTVVTNSVRVAEVFHDQPRTDRTVVLTGGVRTPSDALVGPIAVAALRHMHVDTLFIGVHGFSVRAGFSTPNMLEAETNRAFFAAAEKRVVLADRTKWGLTGLSSFADLADADVLVVDDALDGDALDLVRTQIARVVEVRTTGGASDGSPEIADSA